MTSRRKTETFPRSADKRESSILQNVSSFVVSVKADVKSTSREHFPSPLQREASIENVHGVICRSTPAAIRENIH